MRPRVGVRRKGTRTKRDVLYRFYEADIYIPGPFFNASDEVYGEPGIGDILINNALGFQAVAFIPN